MGKAKTLLFVESPFQLLCAFEAVSFFNLVDYLIIVRFSCNEMNDKQLDETIKFLNLPKKNFFKITIPSRWKRFSTIVHLTGFLMKIFKVRCKNTKVFIGNLDSTFFSFVCKVLCLEKPLLLDDGTLTLTLQKKFTIANNYDLFTIFRFLKPLSNQSIFFNNFVSLRRLMVKDKIPREDKILFLGSSISEVSIISEEYYFDLMCEIANHYKKEIIYVPHRNERKEKVNKVSKIENISVVYLDCPIELLGCRFDYIPTLIASFYSTALFSLNTIYQADIDVFRFEYDKEKYSSIDNVYSSYEGMFNVITCSS